ncbi:glycosyltransferase family 4 protein [Pseudoduganella sp. GCM10020061]|uniref:glycosyltransferase family 4 protein n=1 Tax=Pseudoduganella sp. GCM10020061 TaxID=3317345 RepID=UPI0036436F02
MRVGLLSYPMLFQREGGLQIQVRETLAALGRLAPRVDAILADPARVRLDQFDVVHVFAAIHGNDRVVETARDMGVPVVLSALVPPGWNRANGTRARVADRVLGNVTRWNVHTSYAQMRRALQQATLVVALGEDERRAIRDGFLVDDGKVRVLPNGIAPGFFASRPALFRERSGIAGPFVLATGAVSPYKNQLGIARALSGLDLPFVVIGEAQERDRAYLDSLRDVRGVRWMGALKHDDPMLASAYAAASVFVLPSQGEVAPLSVLEALAAGTPVVMTEDSALSLPGSEFALEKVRWTDAEAQKRAVLRFLATPPAREEVSALVRGLTWDRVAESLVRVYQEALAVPAIGARHAV